MPRGGRRPGAGAPAGNLNALTVGAYSPRFRRAVLILSVSPDLRGLLLAMLRAKDKDRRAAFKETIALADTASRDPKLAKTIRKTLLNKLENSRPQLRNQLEALE